MTEKDWKKEAWQMHISSHQTIFDPLGRVIPKIADEETRKELEKIASTMHNLFDILVHWVEILSDEKLKLEGALEEARKR